MTKNLIARLVAGVMLVGTAGLAHAVPTALVTQGDTWEYSQFSAPDLWSNWAAAGHGSIDWNAQTWSTGAAAFGNASVYNTYWSAGTDLALKKTFNVGGSLNGNLTLNVASDNGFIIFINGVQVAKENAEGFTNYWEYTLPVSPASFVAGSNLIEVLAEDHGGLTFFDMQLTGDVAQGVPEPAFLLLMGPGLIGLLAVRGMKSRKV